MSGRSAPKRPMFADWLRCQACGVARPKDTLRMRIDGRITCIDEMLCEAARTTIVRPLVP